MAAWAALPPKKRLDALLSESDARSAVRAAPVGPLYYAIQEVGLADAGDVVQLASPEQFQGFVDLGGWRKDRLEPSAVLAWLRAARGDEASEFLAKLHGMDLEVLELLVRRYAVVHDLEDNPDANPTGPTVETPEGKFLIELNAEGIELAALRQVLTDLIAENPFESSRLFEAMRWELPTELEETALQFRAARLSDLGFPRLEEAMALFARVELPPPPPAPAGLVADKPVDYAGAALGALTPNERANAEDELVGLSNAVLVVEVADPGNLEAVRRAAEMARDYLNLGLEHLTGGDPARAGEVLRDTPFRRLFQIGFTLTLALKFRADKLPRAGELELLLDAEARTVAALRRKRPLRALKVEGAEPVAFRSRKELSQAEQLLSSAEAQLPLVRGLLEGAAGGHFEPGTSAERVLSARFAWAILDGAPAWRPVPAARVPALLSKVIAGSEAAPALSPEAVALAMRGAPPEARPVADRILGRWVAELGAGYLRDGSGMPTAAALIPVAP